MELSLNSPLKVCFFDSGIGGLNLLHCCAGKLPNARLFYFADNYNVPYGNLPQEELENRVNCIFSEISKLNPSAAVIACNTVTARCVQGLRKRFSFPIIGIQPAVKEAVKTGGKCVVFATPATAESESLIRLVSAFGDNRTEVVACPEFAAFVEQNIFSLSEEKLLNILPDIKADAVVLGCTHYIFVKDFVKKKYLCPVFTGVEGTVKRLIQILGGETSINSLSDSGKITFIGGDEEKNRRVYYEVLCGLK